MIYTYPCTKDVCAQVLDDGGVPLDSFTVLHIEAYKGRFELAPVIPTTMIHPRVLKSTRRLIVVLDDHERGGLGPSGWAQARELLNWSQRRLLRCLPYYGSDLEWLIRGAEEGKRSLLINSHPRRGVEWMKFIREHKRDDTSSKITFPHTKGQPLPPWFSKFGGEVL